MYSVPVSPSTAVYEDTPVYDEPSMAPPLSAANATPSVAPLLSVANATPSVAVQRKGLANDRFANDRFAVGLPNPLGNQYNLGLLGAGAYGNVYRTRDTTTGALGATKVQAVRRNTPAEEAALRAIQGECRQHNVLCLRQAFPVAVQALVTDLVQGGDLAAWIAQRQPMTVPQLDAFTRQLLGALDYIHSRGVYHRDVKPDNVVASAQGDAVTLIDFGVSCAPGTCEEVYQPVGTPAYIWPPLRQKMAAALQGTPQPVSPEEWRANDRYAAARTLIEAYTGERLSADPEAALQSAQDTAVRRPELIRLAAIMTNPVSL